ncbi:hypothetical protein, partial [Paenibacillus thermotolerans]|uniref:hypothetical protein n=1 Tax=Paenibacillus thermotolerans TaxID=3027807 RepID=UPI002367A003
KLFSKKCSKVLDGYSAIQWDETSAFTNGVNPVINGITLLWRKNITTAIPKVNPSNPHEGVSLLEKGINSMNRATKNVKMTNP